MTEKYNRSITLSLREKNGAEIGDIFEEFSFLGTEAESRLPYAISATVTKSITSASDQARIRIDNPLILEQVYQSRNLFLDQLSQNDYSLALSVGYQDDIQLIFSGDLLDISVTGGQSLTDQSIILRAATGHLAFSKARIKAKFTEGGTFRDILNLCFEQLTNGFGIEPFLIDDPEGKLDEKAFKKKRTEDRYAIEAMNSIARELDMTFGIKGGITAVSPQHGYFIDKKSVVDLSGIYGPGPFQLNYQTGLMNLPAFGKSTFTFSHRPDPRLEIGAFVELDVRDKVNSATLFPGRVDAITTTITNKSKSAVSNCTAHFIGDDGLAVLDKNRSNVGAELI